MARILRSIAAAGLAAAATNAATQAASTLQSRALPGAAAGSLERRNFRDRPVSLSTGIGAAAGVCVGALALPGRLRGAALMAAVGAAVAGAYDDVAAPGRERAGDKGLAGHWAAVKRGRPTGGAVKLPLIGLAALLSARQLGQRGVPSLVGAAAIAGTANLVNLLDLRPGRAGKASLMLGAPLLGGSSGPAAAVAIGATGTALPADLGERGMLGDVGANPIGAMLGVRLAALPVPARVIAAAAVVGLNLASERVSFSKLINQTPWLRAIDQWGRAA